jgi:C4-dicarboxylate-specific signal transduction histidine kinase
MSSVFGPQVEENVASTDVFGQVAHELRQPLSNIESIAYYLTLILPRSDAKVQDQLARIRQLVEQSSWILSSGLRLTTGKLPNPETLDLEELITHTISLLIGSRPDLRVELAGDLPLVRLDPRQVQELLNTLLVLVRPLSSGENPAVLRTFRPPDGAAIEVLVSPTSRESGLGAGSELSIESARQIVQAHGGTLHCELDPATGIRIRVMLP